MSQTEIPAVGEGEWTGGELAIVVVELALIGVMDPGILSLLVFLAICAYGVWFVVRNT